jgi:hypothetical protein
LRFALCGIYHNSANRYDRMSVTVSAGTVLEHVILSCANWPSTASLPVGTAMLDRPCFPDEP